MTVRVPVELVTTGGGIGNAVERELSGVRGTVDRIGGSIANVGSSLTRNLTLPLVGLGTLAVREFNGFEEALLRIQNLAGVSADEVAKLSPEIRDVGAAAGIGPKEAADAFFFLQSGLGDTEVAMESLEVATRASAAGLGTVEDISKATVSAIRAYGSENIDAAQAVDIFGAAAKNATAGPDELASALNRITPTAAEAGVELDELAGVSAAISPAFSSADEASTGLQAVFTSVSRASGPMQDALKAVGTDAEGLRDVIAKDGLVAGMELLGEASEESGITLTNMLGSVEANRSVLALLGTDSKTLNGILDDTANASGFVDEAFQEVEKSGAQQMRKAMADVQNALVDVGEVLAPIASDLAGFVSDLASGFSRLSPGTQRMAIAFAGLAAAAGPLLLVVGNLVRAVVFLSGPVGIAVGAIALLAGALITAYRNSETFRRVVDTVARVVGEEFGKIVGMLRDEFVPILEEVGDWAKSLGIDWGFVAQVIGGALVGALKLVGGFLRIQIKLFGIVAKVIMTVVNVVKAVVNWFRDLGSGMQDLAGVASKRLGPAIDVVVGAIETTIKVVKSIIKFMGGFSKAAGNAAGEVRDFASDVSKRFVGSVRDGIKATRDWSKSLSKDLGKAFRGSIRNVLDLSKNVGGGLIKSIRNAIRTIEDMARKLGVDLPGSSRKTKGGFEALGRQAIRMGNEARGARAGFGALEGTLDALGGKSRSKGYAIGANFAAGLAASRALAAAAARRVAAAAARNFPGSPVKEGPLRAFNNGHSGRELVRMLAEGLNAEAKTAEKAMQSVAAGVAAQTPTLSTSPGGRGTLTTGDTSRPVIMRDTARREAVSAPSSNVEVNQIFNGPTTSGGRLQEMEWTMKYATKARAYKTAGVAV